MAAILALFGTPQHHHFELHFLPISSTDLAHLHQRLAIQVIRDFIIGYSRIPRVARLATLLNFTCGADHIGRLSRESVV
jgi:hypothetical protein